MPARVILSSPGILAEEDERLLLAVQSYGGGLFQLTR
jgi:hypothetical protein